MSGLTKRQQLLRSRGIGASEIAVLVNLSRWKTPIEIYEAKLGIGARETSCYPAELGLEIEAPIARVWAKLNKRHIALVDTIEHPHKPFALATPDRAVYLTREAAGDARRKKTNVRDAERLLQVKSTNWRQRYLWGEEHTDSIPDEFVCQAHWEMGVSGVRECTFAVDFDKTKLHEYVVQFDPEIFEGLYEVAERFMIDHVLKSVPPAPDASDAYGEFLARKWPRHSSQALKRVDNTDPILSVLGTYAKLHTSAARLKGLLKLTRNRLAEYLEDAGGLEGEFGKVYFRASKDRSVTDWRKVARESIDLAKLVVQTMPAGDMRAQLAQQLDTLVGLHTTTAPGGRVMRAYWSDAVKKQLDVIDLQLTKAEQALASGDEGSEEEQQQEQSNS